MTEKERLNTLRRALRHLKNTTQGYRSFEESGQGTEWEAAMRDLRLLERDLEPNVPDLGPIIPGGKSVLLHDCTHITDGLGWPAFDDAPTFTKADVGRPVIAPEFVEVDDDTSSAQGGDAFYVKGRSGLRYWVAHIREVPRLGTKFSKGARMTSISGDHPRPHVHLAIDARALLGHHLESHDDYTHGAPRIGRQLAGRR